MSEALHVRRASVRRLAPLPASAILPTYPHYLIPALPGWTRSLRCGWSTKVVTGAWSLFGSTHLCAAVLARDCVSTPSHRGGADRDQMIMHMLLMILQYGALYFDRRIGVGM
jgi:hypothetical protein